MTASETTPLLPHQAEASTYDHLEGSAFRSEDIINGLPGKLNHDADLLTEVVTAETGENFDDIPKDRRTLGFYSAVFLISTRIIGTGIFATPSLILRSSGSIGASFLLWLVGAAIAAAGTAVYLELGTGLPRSGAEKVYLEFIYRKPKYLVSCMYAIAVIFMASAGGGAVVFGEYIAYAFSLPPTSFVVRTIASSLLTFTFILHSTLPTWGIFIQNALGIVGYINLLFIALCGLLAKLGVLGLRDGRELPNNLEWERIWEGTKWDVNGYVIALSAVIWSYIGYSNANYALSEIKDPVRTVKRAAPTALGSITVIYMLVNLAYFFVVEREEIRDGGSGSGVGVTFLFFRNLFGPNAQKVLALMIALSSMGNVMGIVFSSGRVVQELGREAMIPFASIFASSKPFKAPFAALFQQCLFSALSVIIPPPGDAYVFVINFTTYPYAIINSAISLGLILMKIPSCNKRFGWNWKPPFTAWWFATIVFLASNIFLAVAPFVPPADGSGGPYAGLPYWSHATAAVVILGLGVVYWGARFRWLPRWGGYELRRVHVRGDDGVGKVVFRKI